MLTRTARERMRRRARIPKFVSKRRWIGAALIALAGALWLAGSGAARAAPAALDPDAINLIFVRAAETDPATGGLSPRGLQRALRLGPWLVHLTGAAADGIFALAPTTRGVGPAGKLPDLAPLETIEPFALLYAAPIAAATAAAAACAQPSCQGIDYRDQDGANEALVARILRARRPGNFVFAAPPETLDAIVRRMDAAAGWKLKPAPFAAAAYGAVAALSLKPGAAASFHVYRTAITPPAAYPNLHLRGGGACLEPAITISSAAAGQRPPASVNRHETVYFIRHAEAHPTPLFENGNLVCQGEWRAIGAAPALLKKIGGRPDFLYASDPAQPVRGRAGGPRFSYIRPALTLTPFAAANRLPLELTTAFDWWDGRAAERFFFFGGAASRFSGKTVLVAWEHATIGAIVRALLRDYGLGAAALPRWNRNDYDTIWKVRLDDRGNLTFTTDCEGIASGALPSACPFD